MNLIKFLRTLKPTQNGSTHRTEEMYMNPILHKQIYAGLFEIIKDNRYYQYSSFGDQYCKFSDEGTKEVMNWINIMAPKMIELENQMLDKRAKDLVVKELKK